MKSEEIKNMREKAMASCTTFDTMRDFVVQACDTLEDKRSSVMEAYFNLENWLYGEGRNKPIEIKSAMLWGGLWVAKEYGAIDWNEMRNMYGEYMSKAMELR